MKVWGLTVSVCLLTAVSKAVFGEDREKLGELTLRCKKGWEIFKGNCYLMVDVKMNVTDATSTCKRQGGELLYFCNELEYYEFLKLNVPFQHFWTNVRKSNDGVWKNGDTITDLQTLYGYAPYEPDETNLGLNGTTLSLNTETGLTAEDPSEKRAFVCKYPACLDGYVPCATLQRKCIQNKYICDGINDCQDQSDERDCIDRGTYYQKAESGSFSTDMNKTQTQVTITIEAPAGRRIQLRVPPMSLKDECEFVEIWTGAPYYKYSRRMATFTGDTPSQTLYSDNNFMTARIFTTASQWSSSEKILTWTSDIQYINETTNLIPESEFKELLYPFPIDGPKELTLYWRIEAAEFEVITFYVASDPSEALTASPVMYGEGDARPETALLYDNYHVSVSNTVTIAMANVPDDGTTLNYKKGCGMAITAYRGRIISPGYGYSGYPNSLTCEWILTGGSKKQRGMRIDITELSLAKDIRMDPDDPCIDELMVTVGGETISVSEKGKHFDAPNGNITVIFTSGVALTDNGFILDFGAGCLPLEVSNVTKLSTTDTHYGVVVDLECPVGHKFKHEKDDAKKIAIKCVNLEWESSGIVVGNIPSCQVVYCGVPPPIDNGYSQSADGVTYTSNATYACNDGFTPDGSATATCNKEGNWVHVPNCSSSTCNSLTDDILRNGIIEVLAGRISEDNAEFGTVVQFKCNEGFDLVGSEITQCKDAVWTHTTKNETLATCKRLKCPQMFIANADYSNETVEVEGNLTVKCNDGFKLDTGDGTEVTLSCEKTQTYSKEVQCVDIDECSGSNQCDAESTTCDNLVPGYQCPCRPGFTSNTSNIYSCDDINECDDNNGHCDHLCVNEIGSYACSCKEGYVLFTRDGQEGYNVSPSETGNSDGDLYRFNHTCVGKKCDALANVVNGLYLWSDLTSLHYESSVIAQCEDGYKIENQPDNITSAILTCGSNGDWDKTVSCTEQACILNAPPKNGEYDKSSVKFGEVVTLTCKYTKTQNVTRSAKCLYDQAETKLFGDDINSCPEIDCQDLALVLPPGAQGSPSSTKHIEDADFLFTCLPGFEKIGESSNGTDLVKCKENGRWGLGSLQCVGKRCPYPGTPGDAKPVVTSFEIDQELYYQCDRFGLKSLIPDGKDVYTCVYNETSDKAQWSPPIPNPPPPCKDVVGPEYKNCPTETIWLERLAVYKLKSPVPSDNVGVKRETTDNNISEMDIPNDNLTITYTAFDFENNEGECTVNIKIIDRTKPELVCPDQIVILVESRDAKTSDISKNITHTGSLKVMPSASAEAQVDKIGTHEVFTATATDEHGTQSFCTFMVYFSVGACFEEALYMDTNAERTCTGDTADLSCASTCKSGYIYRSGDQSKTFTCTGENDWNFNFEDIFCLEYSNPEYKVSVEIEYRLGGLAKECGDNFKKALEDNKQIFESKIPDICGPSEITDPNGQYRQPLTLLYFTFTLKLLSQDKDNEEHTSCLNTIKTNSTTIFAFENNILNCQTDKDITVEDITVGAEELTCTEPSYYKTVAEDSNTGFICIPCGPGQFYDSEAAQCSTCPDDQYQDAANQYQCKNCGDLKSPDAQKIECWNTCPPGFKSDGGFFPCVPCGIDSYWNDSKTCLLCPVETSTVGIEGATNDSKCYVKCSAGTYSRSGYNAPADGGCQACPRHFYQPLTGQMDCNRCEMTEKTNGEGKTNQSDCLPIFCDSNVCKNGSCIFDYHRTVCECDDGFTGRTCETEIHICDTEPCTNDATCVRGETYTNYTCTCKPVFGGFDCGIDLVDDCENNLCHPESMCLDKVDNYECLCQIDGKYSGQFCNQTTDLCSSNPCDNHGNCTHSDNTRYECTCYPGYTGLRCETNIDECDKTSYGSNQFNATCLYGGTCADGVNDYTCTCAAGFSGVHCEISPNFCSGHSCLGENVCYSSLDEMDGVCGCEAPLYTPKYKCDMVTEGNKSSKSDDESLPDGFNQGRITLADCTEYCQLNPACDKASFIEIDGKNNICLQYNQTSGNPQDADPGNFIIYKYCGDSPVRPYACERTDYDPCDSTRCENGGSCDSFGLLATCSCASGWTGYHCQNSIDDCVENDCKNGECMDAHESFTCKCANGYEGDKCDKDIDECPGTCNTNNSKCIDLVGRYECECNDGYTGSNCNEELDECLSYPCKHGSECTDEIDNYSCSCKNGWKGKNCDENVDHCDNKQCNDGKCYSLASSAFCRCNRGTQGDTCEHTRNVCEALSNIDVCINGGECVHTDGKAECICKPEPDILRCKFDGGLKGWTGGNNYNQSFQNSSSPEHCTDLCREMDHCFAVSFSIVGETAYCFFYNEGQATLTEEGEDNIHFTNICPEDSDYVGASCEMIKDWCSLNISVCKNGGTCKQGTSPGYRCECPAGYSGITCEDVANPCQNEPCSSDATCISYVTDYNCLCDGGKVWTGTECKGCNEEFVLLVDTIDGQSTSSLQSSVSLNSTEMTVLGWFRVHDSQLSSSSVFTINWSKSPKIEDPVELSLEFQQDKIVIMNGDKPTIFNVSEDNFLTDVFDNEWHHIAIRIGWDDGDDGGNATIYLTIDATTSTSRPKIHSATDLNEFYIWLSLGKNIIAEYDQWTIMDRLLDLGEVAQAKVGNPPSGDPIQTWCNYVLNPSVTKLSGRLPNTTNLGKDDTKMPEPIECTNVSNIMLHTSERILVVDDQEEIKELLEALKDMNSGLELQNTLPKELTHGFYNLITVGTDGNSNYGECRSKVYVRYNEECPVPNVPSGVNYTECRYVGGVCDPKCEDIGRIVSAPLPKYMPCSSLGVFNPVYPKKELSLPGCTVFADPRYVVNCLMEFVAEIECKEINDLIENAKKRLHENIDTLNAAWSGICNTTGADADDKCSNLDNLEVSCDHKRITVKFDIEFENKFLYPKPYNGTGNVGLEDVFRIVILKEKKIDFRIFAEAKLNDTSVRIELREDCPFGHNLLSTNSSHMCAPCSEGWYKNTSTEVCTACPLGTYSDQQAQLQCKECQPNGDGTRTTTYQIGADSPIKCFVECTPGNYFDEGIEICKPCPRHYYQDMPGKRSCIPCQLTLKTISNSSSQIEDCKVDCPAGEYRNFTNNCVQCRRGHWRSLIYDDCQKCPEGKTTMEGSFAMSESDCDMDVCSLGNFWNETESKCQPCNYGYYADEELVLECKMCKGNLTTKTMNATNQNECVFYCADGYEVGTDLKTCNSCDRGYYKENEGPAAFEPCKSCGKERTTNIMAATSQSSCSVPICNKGQYIDDGKCTDCPLDTYSNVEVPYTTTECIPCTDPYYGTISMKATNESQCQRYCDKGEYLEDEDCLLCPRGEYKNNVGETRFEQCISCVDKTTDGEGSKSINDCATPKCSAGQYVVESECTPCNKNTYQPDNLPLSTTTCTQCPNFGSATGGTKEKGTANSSLCLPMCPAGEQFDQKSSGCVVCPIGKFKTDSNLFVSCSDCPDGYITAANGSTEETDCNVLDCGPGTYVDGNNCSLCPHGTYQSGRRATECVQCGPDRNTTEPGADSKDDCQVSCEPGKQGTINCTLCPEGTIKPSEGFAECKDCTGNYTSNPNRTECSVLFCYFGFKYAEDENGKGSCMACEEGSIKTTRGNSQTCDLCEPRYTTNGPGQKECDVFHCLAGEHIEGGECIACPVGTFKSDAGNQTCTNCSDGYTTESDNSTSKELCNIVVCPEGQYREPSQRSKCTDCPINQYQNTAGATECKPCGDGKITMIDGRSLQEDCVDKCNKGYKYVPDNKTCEMCAAGFYKDTVGNIDNCTACPPGKTTLRNVAAIAISDCDQTVCPAGTYRTDTSGSVRCNDCEKGTYNPDENQDKCKDCGTGKTTLESGRKKSTDCKNSCPEGSGYNINSKECKQCDRGWYNDKKEPLGNLCKKCSIGTTNLQAGKTVCDHNTIVVPIAIRQTITFTLAFVVELNKCNDTEARGIILAAVKTKMVEVLLSVINTRFHDQDSFCVNDGCTNMDAGTKNCAPIVRNKRAISHKLEIEVIFNNVSRTVTDTRDNLQIDTSDAISQIFDTKSDELVVSDSVVYEGQDPDVISENICPKGSRLNSEDGSCVECNAGMYESGGVCLPCGNDKYQNETGSASCKQCPTNTYHDKQGQIDPTACNSWCKTHLDHCNLRGVCTETGARTASCDCSDGYTGSGCATKQELTSNRNVILGTSIGGGGALLVLILLVIGVYRFMSNKDSDHEKRVEDLENYHNPIFEDGYTASTIHPHQPRPLAPYPSIGYPALGVRPDMGNDDYMMQDVYNKRPSVDEEATFDNSPTYVWQA